MAGPGALFFGEEEKRQVLEVLEHGYLFRYGTPGDGKFKAKVWQLEQAFARYTGTKYALAVNSGTSALLTGLSALGIGPGDEVLVPGYTFIASFSSVVLARAIPVPCEIDDSLTIDPEDAAFRITSRTRAIMPVHMLGNPCDMKRVKAVAKKYKLAVIEDCAQACGGSYRGRKLGSWSDIAAFSFNIFKTITAGDGGALTTSKARLYRRAFAFHDQGHRPLRQGVEIGARPFFGLDFRMTELTAAVLVAQLEKLETILATLREKKALLKKLLSGNKEFTFRRINDEKGECATILSVIFHEKEKAKRVARILQTTTVEKSGWHVYRNMEQLLQQLTVTAEKCPFSCPYYGKKVRYYRGMLPRTEDILSRTINISVGVSDPGLGAGFGIIATSDRKEICRRAEEFLSAVRKA